MNDNSAFPPDKLVLSTPLEGMELTFRLRSIDELQMLLRRLLRRRALVCLSPNRKERCDSPATGVFWQDESEWYPCCDAHWPSGHQWLGHTRFYGYCTRLNLFAERVTEEDLKEAAKSNCYERTLAV